MKVHLFGEHGEFCHVFFPASGVATDKIGDDLLLEVFFAIDAVEDSFECLKLFEGRLSHESQHMVGGVFGCYFQPAADVPANKFSGIFGSGNVAFLVIGMMEQEVVSHAAADKTFLDAWQRVNGVIDGEQATMVGIEIWANLWVDARWAFAALAHLCVASSHAVHVGGGASQIAKVSLEIGMLDHFFYFAQNAFFASADDKFSLVRADGTESASPEAPAVNVDGVFNHLVCGDALAFVFRMR